MLDFSRSFHVGMVVSDIHHSQKVLGESMSLDWSPIRAFDPLPFWTPEDGDHEVVVHACYSRQGPQHIELCQGTGRFYDPALQPDSRHMGVWVDNLVEEAERLLALKWKVLAAGASPKEGYGVICYMQPEFGGLVIELVSTALEPVIAEWVAATE